MSKLGPDIVDVVLCTWTNVAIPTILAGCEMIPFCETRISEIERIQSQIAKFALGISVKNPNICAQTELGLKPFRQVLYEKQLKFFFRALYIDNERWIHQALLDHMSGSWESPYLTYIMDIRSKMRIFMATKNPSLVKHMINASFIEQTNLKIKEHQWLYPLKNFKRLQYVCENPLSAVITEFRLDCPPLGRKIPRIGYPRKPICPVCPLNANNDGLHMLFLCTSVSKLRVETGIQSFINSCTMKGMTITDTYRMFVNGYDWNGIQIDTSDFLERAKCMKNMLDQWLSLW